MTDDNADYDDAVTTNTYHDDDEPYFVEVLSKERGDTTWWFKEHFLERVQPEVQKGKRKAGTSVKQ